MSPTDLPVTFEPLSDRKEGARFFEAGYRVRTDDVDQAMRVRLDAVARFLQDAANDNLDATPFVETDPYWIVRRTIIDVIEPISWPGEVSVERWCGALSTRWTNMRVRVTSKHETNRFNPGSRPDGLIETEGFWINVNEQGMPSRITDHALELLGETALETRLRWKSMNQDTAPDDVVLPDRPHVLRVTDFDPFRHLNNAAYLEAVEDELADHPDLVERPHRLVIEYLRPIVPGTELTLRRRRTADKLEVWIQMGSAKTVAATVSVALLPER
ncbi:acyl-ACP thioesterase [Gordonia sp. TBRC 11910]|uniref:Acyl-ACP thioesterase n=1 Tax=Gordonia asplenii TaxID=2725283 RepID=A0A848L1L6_9ACTN|nr:acyl-ACP thioesterase domain-containing protein [Gordonia asplenii]NMO04599.1 acyl-ACP thioesterase [Gordonia asplenii]